MIPEGFSTRDIAAPRGQVRHDVQGVPNALKAADPPKGFLEKGETSPQLEGFLFPAATRCSRR